MVAQAPKPESKAARQRRLKAASRAIIALRPTITDPEFENPAPKGTGLGWTASLHGSLYDSALRINELVERVWYNVYSYRLGNAPPPPRDKLGTRPSASSIYAPVFPTRLDALVWLRRKAERVFGTMLADIDDAIAAEEKTPTPIEWTDDLVRLVVHGPRR